MSPAAEAKLGQSNYVARAFSSPTAALLRGIRITPATLATSRFIAEDVVAWARQSNVGSNANLLCGLSLGGLQAAMTVFHYPSVFSYALCQSASFWWFADHAVSLPPTAAKFWLSIGDDETATHVSHPPGFVPARLANRGSDGCRRTVRSAWGVRQVRHF
jgi:pimeloyl-ACP methyl ester carboxylesterase